MSALGPGRPGSVLQHRKLYGAESLLLPAHGSYRIGSPDNPVWPKRISVGSDAAHIARRQQALTTAQRACAVRDCGASRAAASISGRTMPRVNVAVAVPIHRRRRSPAVNLLDRRVRKPGVNHAVRKIIRPEPKPNSRQHERGLNKRTQRIRTRNPGVRAEPWGFRAHPKPTILKPENSPKAKETTECWGYLVTGGEAMASTKWRLEIGATEVWLPWKHISNRFLHGLGAPKGFRAPT